MVPMSAYTACLFQLPPSHEGEPALRGLHSPVHSLFQLPPSHEGERRLGLRWAWP